MLEKISTTFRIEDKRKRIALAILLFVMGIFLSISFSSFFFTWENDQSELLNKNAFEVLFSNNNAEDPALAESIPSTASASVRATIMNWLSVRPSTAALMRSEKSSLGTIALPGR